MDGFEALVCTEMYKACTNDSDFWDFLTVESDLGICDIADFIAQASEEYIRENLEEKYSRCTWDLVKMFFENNKSRWKSEIRGEKKFKVRMVIEVDALDVHIEDVGRNASDFVETIVSNKYDIYDGGMPCKVIEIQSVEEVKQ